MKKLVTLLIATALTIVSLVGCGGGNNGGGGGNNPNNPKGKYNLTIAVQKEGGEVELMELFKEAYEKKNPDVNIEIKDFKGALFESYMSKYAMSEKDLPMMIWMPDDQFDYYAAGGYFVDLRKYYEQDAATDYSLYYESMLHAASYSDEFRPTTSYTGEFTVAGGKSDSRQYGVYFAPRDYNQIAIVYNKKLFNNFGIEVPDTSNGWTFAEYVALIQEIEGKIKAGGNKDLAKRAANLMLPWEPAYTTIFNALGSDGLVKDGAYNADSEKNKQICEYLYNEIYCTKQRFDTNNSFTNGTVFMMTASRPLIKSYADKIKNSDGTPAIDFLPYPAEYVAAGCSGYGITSIHEKETQTVNGVTKTVGELAWDFIKFIISEEGQELSGASGYTQPILKSLAETGSWLKAIDENLNHKAFAQGKELSQTIYNSFDPQSRASLRSIYTTTFGALQDVNTGAPNLMAKDTFPKYKEMFRKEAKTFDPSKYE